MHGHKPSGTSVTGNAFPPTQQIPPANALERPITQKEKVEEWFIEPLRRMKGHEAFACLTLCFPLIETIARFELGAPDEQHLTFSDNSPALHWFAKFMTIPEAEAQTIWDAFRNGLLHRAMVKSSTPYTLTPGRPGRPAEFRSRTVVIHVWELRDAVIKKLEEHRSKLWKGSSQLPKILIVG